MYVNNQIRAREVRVIDKEGEQLGIMTFEEALRKAKERGLDLVQVTEKVDPPVCKILDYGKYLYREEKKRRGSITRKGGDLKGIRLRFNIAPHDLKTRVRQTEKFIKEGHKIRIEMQLRGREKTLQSRAEVKVNEFLEDLKTRIPFKVEKELRKEARGLTMIISKA